MSILHRNAVITLLVLHAGMLAYGAWIHGPGVDEIGHLPAGLCVWRHHDFGLYRVNPPLVRSVATYPLSFLSLDIDYVYTTDVYSRVEFDLGELFWERYGLSAYRYLMWARFTAIPFSLLAGIGIYHWSSTLYGRNGAIFSMALWCFSPLVLANAQMITPDVGACALGTWAYYFFYRWLRDQSWHGACVAGVLLGLAELTKFTWIILFPLFILQWFGYGVLKRSIGFRSTGQFVVLGLVAISVMNAGYGFSGSFKRLREYRFVCETLRGGDNADSDNRFSSQCVGWLPVPLPAEYVRGIDRQKFDFEGQFDSYLRGEWRNLGWWYYYLYGIAIKTPSGYLGLFVLSLASYMVARLSKSEIFLLAPAILIIALVSSQTGFNHHLRYILPALPFFYICAGRLWSVRIGGRWKYAAATLLAFGVAPSLWVFPHSHAYFNCFVGGPMRGHDHLLDSNIDWGQDILELAKWNKNHPNVDLDGIALSHNFLNLENLGLPVDSPPKSDIGPQPGWWAVFVNALRDRDRKYEYFRFFDPDEVLGYTVYIYHLSEADVERYWNSRANE